MRRSYLEVTFRKGRPIAAYLYLPRPNGVKVARTVEVRPQIQVDYSANGDPIGVELTAPAVVDVSALNAVLEQIGAPSLEADDLKPLRAA
ncbi:MAG: DUF2283 domain-containing protein [Acidobacteriota bacterium]